MALQRIAIGTGTNTPVSSPQGDSAEAYPHTRVALSLGISSKVGTASSSLCKFSLSLSANSLSLSLQILCSRADPFLPHAFLLSLSLQEMDLC